jgi:hypothetical protein
MAKSNKKSNIAVLENKPLRLAPPTVRIEFPRDGETIAHPSYAIRIATSVKAAGVDVCIDQGEWQPCRESLGLWWYDWSGYDCGEHEAVARLRKPDGGSERSDLKVFMVKLP